MIFHRRQEGRYKLFIAQDTKGNKANQRESNSCKPELDTEVVTKTESAYSDVLNLSQDVLWVQSNGLLNIRKRTENISLTVLVLATYSNNSVNILG